MPAVGLRPPMNRCRTASLTNADRCLLRESAVLSLANPDAAGLLERRSNLSGWYQYWFSLRGSQLQYFERTQSNRRGLLVGTISLFRHKLVVINSIKRRREFEVTDLAGKVHVLRAASDAELHWWVQLFGHARNKIPPAHPIATPTVSPETHPEPGVPNTVVDTHMRVDHVLCVVHGIGVNTNGLSSNIGLLQESYAEVMAKVFPDIDFGIEVIAIYWRDALTSLDIHQKLRAVVPRAPVVEAADDNPLKHMMEHRVVDFVYYTHPRYRRHMLRAVCERLNTSVRAFRKRRPDYNGGFSVMGHSLGAALSYELFSRRVQDDQTLLVAEGIQVDFMPENLFCLGSPLGTLCTLDDTIGAAPTEMTRLPFRIYNVFKYHDPIATRLEPLRDIRLADMPPVMVPCWINMGLRESTAQWFGSLWHGQRKQDIDVTTSAGLPSEKGEGHQGEKLETFRRNASAPAGLDMSESSFDDADTEVNVIDGATESKETEAVNAHLDFKSLGQIPSLNGSKAPSRARSESEDEEEKSRWSKIAEDMSVRMDYALQVSSTMEEMSTSWSAIKAHTEYWSNRDAMLLMVSTMIKTTFGMADFDDYPPGLPDGRSKIVDSDILSKSGAGHVFSMSAKWSGSDEEKGDQRKREAETIWAVSQLLEKIVDDAAAMVSLVRQHPAVRMHTGGGVSSVSVVTQAQVTVQKAAAVATASTAAVDDRTAGWAAYFSASLFGMSSSAENGKTDNQVALSTEKNKNSDP